MRPLLWCGFGLLAVLIGFVAFAPSPAELAKHPHVILISLDTVRADHLACYGHPFINTPRLDALAAEGVRFADVTAAAPTTLASHTSLMTGTYPHTHGVPRNGFVIYPDNRMLAEALRDAGYTTAAFLGSFALERRFGFDQGFEHFDQEFDLMTVEDGVDQNQRRAERVTDATLAYLERERPARAFLFVHYFDAHAPYDPPPPFDAIYAPGRPDSTGSLAEIAAAVDAHHKAAAGEELGQVHLLSDGLTAPLVTAGRTGPLGADEGLEARYCGEVSYVDQQVGRLLDGLRRQGLYEDSLIVVTSDHGETMWEHADVWNHGLWVYDTTVRVPLIVRLPRGQERGRAVEEPVSGIDIMPTVLELVGESGADRIEGKSLAPLLRGQPMQRGEVFSEATQPYRRIESSSGWRNALKPKCVRAGQWKYIAAPYLQLEELYDLKQDPGEQRNLLAPSLDEHTAAMLGACRESVQQWHKKATPLPSQFDSTHHQETLDRLKSLGYVGGDETDPAGTSPP